MSAEQQLHAKSAALHTKYSAAALSPDPVLFPLYDDTAFNVACVLGHVRVMMALDNAGARRNIVNSNGMSALHAAAANCQAAVVEYLASKPDVDQDLQTPHDLNTALHLACASGCDESVKVLVSLACAS
jgi:ankyrin repeat protein